MPIDNSTRARRRRRFQPFVAPTRPPAGTYDPQFDAQERAAGRGLEDLRLDTERGRVRDEDDLRIGREDIGRQRGDSLADLLRGADRTRGDFGNSLADLLTGRAREGEDYGRSIAGLERNYRIRGQQQAQAANAAGGVGGGIFAAAGARRAENQAIDREPIDIGHRRYGEDSARSEQRLGEQRRRFEEDFETGRSRLHRDLGNPDVENDYGLAGGRLGLGFTRRAEDRDTGLTRAERENTALGQDLGASRFFQATQSGLYTPPAPPRGEYTRRGVTYRRQGGQRVLPDGRVVSLDQLRSMYR